MHAVQPWIIWNMVHSFQFCFVRGLDCLKAFQSLSRLSSPPPPNKINPTRFLSTSSMCDRNCVSDTGRAPDLSALPGDGEGAGEGCLLDQLGWEGTWGPGVRGACSAGSTEEWEGRMLPLAWDARRQAGTCLGGCFLRGDLLGAGGYNRQQLVKSRGWLQVN